MGKTRFHKMWPLSYAGDSHLQHNKEAAGKPFQHTCLLVLRFFCNIRVKVEVKIFLLHLNEISRQGRKGEELKIPEILTRPVDGGMFLTRRDK